LSGCGRRSSFGKGETIMLNLEPVKARLANTKNLPWKTGWDEDSEEYYLEDSTGRALAVGIAEEIVICLEHYPNDLRVLVGEVERLRRMIDA
jgi:hypothetical protein